MGSSWNPGPLHWGRRVLSIEPPGKSCLISFDWMSDIVNLAWLTPGYFSICVNILELCSGMQLLHGDRLRLSSLTLSFVEGNRKQHLV